MCRRIIVRAARSRTDCPPWQQRRSRATFRTRSPLMTPSARLRRSAQRSERCGGGGTACPAWPEPPARAAAAQRVLRFAVAVPQSPDLRAPRRRRRHRRLGHPVDAAVILAVVAHQRGDRLHPGGPGRAGAGRHPRDADAARPPCCATAAPHASPAEELVPGDIVLLEAGDRVAGRPAADRARAASASRRPR